jgi:uncharacterized membrane protein
MILFSDAVFAIVITLMAIEIHLPEHIRYETDALFFKALGHVAPTIFGYALSFFFIGQMWYKHLKMFSLLKDYNKGLIIRNLIFLFFIGLFPFGASLIFSGSNILSPVLIYFAILISCFGAQIFLHHYIINKSKGIIIQTDLTEERLDLKKRTLTIITMFISATLAYITAMMIENKDDKAYGFVWILVFVVIARVINAKLKSKKVENK